jgi:tetraacyldisaccharide 4'-kinase
LHYRDHHPYSDVDVEKMTSEFKKSDSDYLVTTEKDAVKLQSLFPRPEMLWSASLKVTELGHKGRLHEIISQLLRATG